VTFLLAGFNAIADWKAFAWTPETLTEAVEGSATVWLWLLVSVAGLATVGGAALWTIGREEDAEDEEDEEAEYDANDVDYVEEEAGRPDQWA
jgi:hypothetical protein